MKKIENGFGFILCFVLMFFISFTLSTVMRNEIEDGAKFDKTKEEDEVLFGKYNNDYKPEVQNEEDGILVTVTLDNKYYGEKGNQAIINYLSNTGGKLLSLNGVNVENVNKVVASGAISVVSLIKERENVFNLLVPRDSPAIDNLQERIELYARYAK